HALEHHVERLAEDHANARLLAEGLSSIPGIECDPELVQTNMLFPTVVDGDHEALAAVLADRGVLVRPARTMRLVLHLDVHAEDLPRVVDAFAAWAKGEDGTATVAVNTRSPTY
ncbi:hypothetical protein B7486_73650, partial [cyanobacterium TDX16]